MINYNIYPVNPTGFRIPTETEKAIFETLKLCGISGEDASMIFIKVMKKLGKNDNISAGGYSLWEMIEMNEPDEL